MPIRNAIGIFCLAAVATNALLATAQELRWKFEVGDKLNYKMLQDMTMSAEGGPVGAIETKMHQEMDMTWDVQQVDEQGDAVIRQTFDRLSMKMESPFGGFDYDSKSEEAPVGLAAMIAPMYKAMTEAEFIITMTARGEVKDVTIPEQVLAAIKNSPGAAAMGDMATEDGFKKMISQGALVLPNDPPQQGDSWSTVVEMNNPMAGKQTVETTYRYEGIREVDGTKFAVMRPELKMDFAAADPAQPGQPPVEMKIAEQTSDGEVLFDMAEGRLRSSNMKQNVTIDVTAGGQSMQQKIKQDIQVDVTPAE